jgi:hypothetical protein
VRILQASPRDWQSALEKACALGCDTVAWSLDTPTEEAVRATEAVGLKADAWLQVARDPEAIAQHPEWMHCPQHHEWIRRFPEFAPGHPALVAPYIGLNTRDAFEYALGKSIEAIGGARWAGQVWLADIQGPPMGCGCGNPSCRSWDNAPGPKLASTPYDRPEILFPLEFYAALSAALPGTRLVPVLCPECERFISLDGVDDPDGPEGTDLCQGIPCGDICTRQYFPKLLTAFRTACEQIGLLLMVDALEKNHAVFGPPRAWATHAHRHYGVDLIACVEPEDASRFEQALILTDAPQDCWPVPPPPGYRAEVPPIMCGYCPPGV